MNTFETGQQYVMNTYSRFPIAFERGEGMYLYDEDGREYLDFVAGIAVNSLGHADKELTEAITAQAAKLIHCSNLYYTRPQVTLAEKLVKHSCFDNVFFCNSGAEAIEAALKLIRKYGSESGGKTDIIAMDNSFHGRTYGAVTATGQEKYHKGFAPLLPGITHVPFNDFSALESAVTERTGGILIEPVQGEGGIRPADAAYLKRVRQLCDEKDILLVFDEVQCGVGRTGGLFAYELYGVQPDAAAIAKGIAGGVPMGALLANKKTSGVLKPGDHASTFGGNPLAAAAANVVIDRLTGGLLGNVKRQGEYLTNALNRLKSKHEEIKEVRGVGLLQGIELSTLPAAEVVKKCIDSGLLVIGAGAGVVRFVPALIVDESHIDTAMEILDKVLGD